MVRVQFVSFPGTLACTGGSQGARCCSPCSTSLGAATHSSVSVIFIIDMQLQGRQANEGAPQ